MTPYENVERELDDTFGRPMVLFNSGFSTFSNFHLCPFVLEGRTYRTSEQYYQSAKAAYFGDYDKAEQIRAEPRPSRCKKLVHDIKNFRADVWQTVAKDVMLKAVLAKFRQNSPAKEKLLKTENTMLVEATLFDTYWASGLDIRDDGHRWRECWRGANVLGEVLMELKSRDLWKEMVDIENGKENMDPSHVARAFGHLRAADPSASLIVKRQAGGMECCTCHRGQSGPAGAPGADGRDGSDGQNGAPGEPGRPAANAESQVQFPPQCPCEADAGPQGPGGPKGTPGAPGQPGQDGNPGNDGTPGSPGPKGPPGPPGRGGPPGQRGSPGSLREQGGPPGQPGNPGTPGAPGRPGSPGKDGQNGNFGPQGPPGDPGRRGSDGRPGNPGRPGGPGDEGPLGSCTHCPAARLAPGY